MKVDHSYFQIKETNSYQVLDCDIIQFFAGYLQIIQFYAGF